MPEYLVAGLGNPGERYARTRHNIGFRVIDALCETCRTKEPAITDGAEIRSGTIEGIDVLLVKPLCYMNQSGPPIFRAAGSYGVPLSRVIAIHDDMDLVFGRIKIKEKGGSAGHKGIQSIIDTFQDDGFIRIRMGIGHPPAGVSGPDHVLSAFSADESERLPEWLRKACDAVATILCRGTTDGMNRFNRA
ncbi:aminoacyl-tRNA hydrolase [Desulfatirhabdium butyrativorans]|uniref:aminoacyl-tRNA hydrolase n=1 Tax=Desulfatirhabdium butyrativorans TaxID=340467 RepID=UPI0003FC0467|nr:aminoacyl-tRNA hydrolase [Desulfatirhabdium butyrativorans]